MSVAFREATVRGGRAETRAWRENRLRSAISKTKAGDEARRRGFGDERSGRSLSEMTKRVKSDETRCRTLSKMPRAAFICPASGTQPFSDEAICAGLHPADVLVYVKGCKDAQIAHIKSGVRLPRYPPQFDKSHTRGDKTCNTAVQ